MSKVAILVFCLLATSVSTREISPPRGLLWKMPLAQLKVYLQESDGLKVKSKHQKLGKAYREYPELEFPDGFFRAEIKKAKLRDKKVQRTYAVFNESDEMVSFQYLLKWDNNKSYKGARKAWVYHSDLKDLLQNKYGKPMLDESHEVVRARDIASGTKYTTRWSDSSGVNISLIVTRQTHNLVIAKVDAFLVFLIYSMPGETKAMKMDDDDL